MTRINTATRISVALASMVMAVLFTAQFIRLVPDERGALLKGRKTLAESLAIQASWAARNEDLGTMRAIIKANKVRNNDIRSIALRRENGELLMSSSHHEKLWADIQDEQSTSTHFQVPIFRNEASWGTLEIVFPVLERGGYVDLIAGSGTALTLFIGSTCFLGFAFYLRKTLRHLDPSAVVPERVKIMLDTLAEGVVVLDHHERIVLANESFSRTVGRETTSLLGHKPSDIPWTKPRSEEAPEIYPWTEATKQGEARLSVPLQLSDDQGTARNFIINAAPIRSADGKPRGALATFDDITEVEEKNVQLELATRAKSDFLASMSHEIRTPMNGVVGMLSLLGRTTLDDRQGRYARVAASSADSLLGLINDSLDFSKIEADKIELECIAFDLCDLVERVADTFSQKASEKKLELIASVEPGVPTEVKGDPDRLRQIVTNLVNNALKFTEKGEVKIRATLKADTDSHADIAIGVSDTGIGIPEDRIDRLFKSFSQVDASTTRKYGGTGLGLAISKRLTELMGGEIGVTSVYGEGTTFTCTVHLEKDSESAGQGVTLPAELRGAGVLVVDANASTRDHLQEQMAHWGLEVTTAAGRDEAAAALEGPDGSAIRFVLLEGAMDGLESMVASIRGRTEAPSLIYVNNIDTPFDAARLKGLGGAAQVTKPIHVSDVLRGLRVAAGIDSGEDAAGAGAGGTVRAVRAARILLAEDNEVNQMVATEILGQAGFTTDVVVNGVEAVEAVTGTAYDLVLMDSEMPEMDGLTATRTIRERQQQGGITTRSDGTLPIIALTANAMKGTRERCLESGMDEYLTKPLDPELLVRTINGFIADADVTGTEAAEVETAVAVATANSQSAADEALVIEIDGPLDVEEVLRRCMGNVEFLEKMFDKFRERSDEDIAEIEAAISQRDADEVAHVAHRFKGAAANVSAEALREAAYRLEEIGKDGDLDPAEACLEEIRSELKRCLDFIPQAVQVARGGGEKAEPVPAATSASAAAESDDDAPINHADALKRCMGNADFLRKMLEKFQAQSETDVGELAEALEQGDAERLARVAHRFKGAAANISAGPLREAALALEQSGRDGDLEAAATAFDAVRSRLAECTGYIPAMLDGKAPTANAPSAAPDTPDSPDADDAPIDRADALKRCMGNEAFLEKMLGKFQEQSVEDVEQLSAALAEGDAESLPRVAHRFKGAAANISAEPLRAAAFRLEQIGRSGEIEPASAALAEIKAELARCVGYIAAVLGESASDVGAGDTAPAADAPVESVARGDDVPIDIDDVLKRCMGSADFLEKMLEKFRQRADEDLDELEQAIAEANPKQAAHVAHRFKGAAANISAERLRETALQLEQMGRDDDLEQANAALESIRSELERCLSFMPAAVEQIRKEQEANTQ
ncbi:MAG: hypothetical protein CMJ18_06585 [Phycisphaeraceae bacterium]|nr:hypothetical protein [Phycisphaeraceae bacterium]